MARPKEIPKRLPPVTKELSRILISLQNLIPTIARFERSSLALVTARQALDLDLDLELRKTRTPKQGTLATESPTQTSTPTRTRRKKIDLAAEPPGQESNLDTAIPGTEPPLILSCSGGCGKTTDSITDDSNRGEFKQVDESGVPDWTCPDCLEKLYQESLNTPEESQSNEPEPEPDKKRRSQKTAHLNRL